MKNKTKVENKVEASYVLITHITLQRMDRHALYTGVKPFICLCRGEDLLGFLLF